MFLLSIILGLFLYPSCCYEVNKANVTLSPADSSRFNINIVGEASRNGTHRPHGNGASQNINDNYRPSETQTTIPSQNQSNPVTTNPESINSDELFIDRFPHQTTDRTANPRCQTNSGSSQDNCTRNGDLKMRPPTPTFNVSMRAEAKPEIGGKPVPPFSENPNITDGNRDFSVALSSKPTSSWESFFDPDPPVTTYVKKREFLWQVSVFSKEVSPFVRVCGGSLVTSSAVISAAQCFWGVGPLPADKFVVGAGVTEFDDIDDHESYQHWGDVQDIKLPPWFRGAASSFQDDLAVVVLARPLPAALRPVCVSFDWELDEQQLKDSVGWVVGIERTVTKWWPYGPIVRQHRVPHLAAEQCLTLAHEDQLRFLTSDKICAGFRGAREPSLCNYDTGSGLVYYADSSHSVPYLRGVVSLALGDSCVTVFTHVGTHRAFLLRHLSGLEAECARHYPGAGGAVKEEEGGKLFVCNCYC